MPLTTKEKQRLKAKAHALKPIILIGHHGLTKAVHHEIELALKSHELIKIRLPTEDRTLRKALFAEICKEQQAEPIQLIGNVAIIYRKAPH